MCCSLDVEQFAKLARDMKVPIAVGNGSGSKSPAGGTTTGQPSAEGGEEEDEDEFPGGLCW